MHHLLYVPELESAATLSDRLGRSGNLTEDGRPTLAMDAGDLLEATLESGDGAYLVPAHVWTPWVGVLSATTGFDSIEACYGELARHLFAIETGLSADPPMDWRVSRLDRFRSVSYSDAHAPSRLGREATEFATELDYLAIRRALETGDGLQGTLAFFPEQGRYHLSEHRRCGVRLEPAEARRARMRCPVCGKRLTMGVLQRVEDLADRPAGVRPAGAAGWRNLLALDELVAGFTGVGPTSKTVRRTIDAMVELLGPELPILVRLPLESIDKAGFPAVAEAIGKVRRGEVVRDPGFDGQYGSIRPA
ncbi:MAG TPA: endonuclease Q family protein [Actinomycetota bacterium]|nr:endonuclease Q family protein [Actinomycetota bacterium]